jgi:hypothetical protein
MRLRYPNLELQPPALVPVDVVVIEKLCLLFQYRFSTSYYSGCTEHSFDVVFRREVVKTNLSNSTLLSLPVLRN